MFKSITCFEWDKITDLSDEQFSTLEKWQCTYNKRNRDHMGEEDAGAIIKFGYVDKKAYVTFTKYVGVLGFKDGLTIEVLPKIFRSEETSNIVSAKPEHQESEKDYEYSRALVLTMLRSYKQLNGKYFQKAHLSSCKLPLLEIFIRMFVDEVNDLVRQGLRCGYEIVERNESVFKGKLIVSKQIQYNAAHRERCYVQYDEFSVNRLENRLIKSTLEFLSRFSTYSQNRTALKRLLDLFEDVDASTDFKTDITQYHRDRNMTEYDDIMTWCRLFMEGRSFSIYHGSKLAFALMYPMEKLYEMYIANCFQRILHPECSISIQENELNLFEAPECFLLKPDIVISSTDEKKWILDTKWKVLNDEKDKNYGISQSDMYQMYAYYHRYVMNNRKVQSVVLLYPENPDTNQTGTYYLYKESESENSAKIFVFKINLAAKINLYAEQDNCDGCHIQLWDKIDKWVEDELRKVCEEIEIPVKK